MLDTGGRFDSYKEYIYRFDIFTDIGGENSSPEHGSLRAIISVDKLQRNI